MDIEKFTSAIIKQDKTELQKFFRDGAVIYWHCTNERFTVEEYVRVNCEYPGDWDGEIEKTICTNDGIVVVLHVYPMDKSASFHSVSFIKLADGLISQMDEYWADDVEAPAWRRDLHIGMPIKEI